MTSRSSIAIDPGDLHGAAALVVDRCVVGWAAWRRTRRQSDPYDVASSPTRRVLTGASLPWAIDCALVHLPPDVDLTGCVAALERIEPHGARTGYTALAESAGVARSALYRVVGDPLRCAPRDWRPAVLGLPGTTSAADSERHAAALWGWGQVRRRKPWPLGEGSASCPEPPAWALGHVAEAACMAAWAAE